MNLTLDDFRNILGKVNDGDVVFKMRNGQKTGIEKANYGWLLKRNVQNIPLEDNAEIRRLFADAISNALGPYGPSISEETLRSIKTRLGIVEGAGPQPNTLTRPLDRREIKAILEIVDGSCEQIKIDNEILGRMNAGVNLQKREQFANSVNASPLLSGTDDLKTIIPERTFRGFKRSEVARCVKENLALVKALTLDEMMWHYEDTHEEIDVATALKASLKKLMVDFAKNGSNYLLKGEASRTRTRQLFAAPPAPQRFDDNEGNADEFFTEQKLMPEGDLAALLTDDSGEGTDAFSKLVLQRAKGYVEKSFRDDFQECITNNDNSAQRAQAPYDARTRRIRMELAEFANDVRNITMQDKTNLAKFRSVLARNIAETFRGVDPSTLGPKYFRDVFLWALRKTVTPFSMRELAKKFADGSTHVGLKNADVKSAYVEDFNGRVAKLPDNAGDKINIAFWQAQAFNAVRRGKPVPALSNVLKGNLDNQYAVFKAARDEADPVALRARRETRNRDAALRVLTSVKGEAWVNGLTPQTLGEEIKKIQARFYNCVHGRYSLNDPFRDDLSPEEKEARVSEWIASADDDEIAFLEKFCTLRLDEEDDSLQRQYFEATKSKMEHPPLYSALRDSGEDFGALTRDSAAVISTIMHLGLIPFMKDDRTVAGGMFMCMMKTDGVRDNTFANCEAFIKQLQREIDKQKRGKLMEDIELMMIKGYKAPEMMAQSKLAGSGSLDVKGFGTLDLVKILNLLKQAGIDLKDCSCENREKRADACVRLLTLMHFAKHNNYNLDSLPEFIQRVTGKDEKAVSFSDYIAFLKVKADKRDAVRPGDEALVNLITGKVNFSEAGLEKDDVAELRTAFAALRKPGAKPVTVTIMGDKRLVLERLPDGGVRAALKTGANDRDFKLYRFSQNADDLSRAIDDIVIANAKDYVNGQKFKGVLLSVLPPVPNHRQGDSLIRAREVYTKTICAFHPERKPVDFAHIPTDALRQMAVDAVEDKPLPPIDAKPQTYNSAEMIEMHRNMAGVALVDVDRKVKLPPDAVRRSEESRRTDPPNAAEFRAIIADLFLNEDTWAFDLQVGAPSGERIRKLLLANSLELKFVFADIDGFARHIDPEIRDGVVQILTKLKDIPAESLRPDAQGNVADDVRQKLAEVETLVDALVKTYTDTMQEKVTALFGKQQEGDDDRALQYQTFAEISGKASINPKTAEGQLTLAILNGYFKKSARVDQRAMLATMVRNTDNNSTDAKKVAELLKGAGPLLQKLLQGLPISAFNEETQEALKAMKSRLAPIPADAVKAQLFELVNSSNGEILSIEVKKSLGAATVGQAFLCHIKTKDSPVTGIDCVIKVLRPNIYTAALREKAIFDDIIKESVPSQEKTFEIRYRGILEEFDLTIEADNVRLGRAHYEHPSISGKPNLEINSMELMENVRPTTNTLVLKKVDGVTYDQYIDDIHAEANETVAHIEPNAIRVNGRVTRPCSSIKELLATRRRLEYLKAYLGEKRNHISDFARVWFENGIYGNGFMHGDLHAGNIMVSSKGATVIDFGNCIRLTKAEQEKIRNMVTKASIGFGEDAIKTFRELLGESARKKLDDILANKGNDAHYEEFKRDLYGIFKKGTSKDVMARIYAAMNLMQREGVEIPGSIAGFFQSYSRLSDIYETMTAEMERIDALIDTLVLDEHAVPDVIEKAPQAIKDFVALLKGLSSDPYKEFDFAKYAAVANKFIPESLHALKDDDFKVYGGEKNLGVNCKSGAPGTIGLLQGLLNPTQEVKNATISFLEWLCDLELPSDNILSLRKGPENADANKFDARPLKAALGMIRRGEYGPDTLPTVLSETPQLFEHCATVLAGLMNAQRDRGGLKGVKETRDKPIFEVCGEVVSEKLADKSPMSLLWNFISEFVGRMDKAQFAIRESKRFANKFDTRKEYATKGLEERNDELGEDIRLTKEKRRILMRQMETFAWPFDGAWEERAEKGEGDEVEKLKVGFPKDKWPRFIEALTVNLNDLKTALGFDANAKLPPVIARLAVTYLAQIDPRAAMAVKSLEEDEYDALLAGLWKSPEAEMLTAAVSALKSAPGDAELFASNPDAVDEFNEIDADADAINTSPWKLLQMGMKHFG